MSLLEVFSYIRLLAELTVISPVLLWVFYATLMIVKERHPDNKYAAWEYLYAGPMVLFFYLVDVYVNYTIFSLLMWEFPKSWKEEKTVSERLDRYYHTDHGWRTQVTAWIGPILLDPWDPRGKHIGYEEPKDK